MGQNAVAQTDWLRSNVLPANPVMKQEVSEFFQCTIIIDKSICLLFVVDGLESGKVIISQLSA